MNKLAKILQLAEFFYKSAMQALAEPTAATMPDDPEEPEQSSAYSKLFDMWDTINNTELARKIDLFLDTYTKYIRALNNPSVKNEDDETFIDIGDALNSIWATIVKDEYLNEIKPDEPYDEAYASHEVFEAIQSLLDDANAKKNAKAKELGFTEEEMAAAEKAVNQELNLPQGAKDVRIKMDEKLRQNYDNKVRKQLEYQQTFRNKLKTIRDLGVDNLTQKREELKKEISQATDNEKLKELEKRFNNMPDPQLLLTHQAGLKRRYDAMMKDDTKRTAHHERLKKRQATQRAIDAKRLEIIEKIESATSSETRNHLAQQLVKLEEKVLELKKVDLDNEWVRNDPKIQRLLDPAEIIRRHSKRKLSKQKQSALEYEALKALMLSGTFLGSLETLLKKIVNYKASAKKAVVDSIIADVEREREADLKPYKDAIDLAVRNKDEAGRLAAIKSLNAAMNKKAINDRAELHPEIQVIATRCNNFRDSVYELKRSSEEIQAGTASEGAVINAVTKLKGIIAEANGKRFTNAMVEHAASIISYLTQRK